VEGVSIADIMGAAGLTPGGFYKHFASKEALIDEAFALAFQQALGVWDQVAQRGRPDGDSALAALVRFYFRPGRAGVELPAAGLRLPGRCAGPRRAGHRHLPHGVATCWRASAGGAAGRPPRARAPSTAEVDLLFAAMVGTGLLARAVGDASWIRDLQAAVLDALPAPPSQG
jgi:TetR/AcrR family transcriptional repressor of nem operon